MFYDKNGVSQQGEDWREQEVQQLQEGVTAVGVGGEEGGLAGEFYGREQV